MRVAEKPLINRQPAARKPAAASGRPDEVHLPVGDRHQRHRRPVPHDGPGRNGRQDPDQRPRGGRNRHHSPCKAAENGRHHDGVGEIHEQKAFSGTQDGHWPMTAEQAPLPLRLGPSGAYTMSRQQPPLGNGNS